MLIESRDQLATAKELMTHPKSLEDLREAEKMLAALGETQLLEKCRTAAAYWVGETVEFGRWNDQPIRWKVVDKRGRMRLLVSEQILFRQAYHKNILDLINWSLCSLRTYLNREFIREAFTPTEQLRIMANRNVNQASPSYATGGGPDTMDRVFIPSLEELDKYFPTETERILEDWWWVRTPGSNLRSAVAIYTDGTAYEYGLHNDYANCGVRPALWVMLKI